MKRRVLIALVVALALALGLTASVSATPPIPLTKTVYVDQTWGTDTPLCGQGLDTWACKTITYAIDNIAIAGDTVTVAAGTYDTALGEVFPIVVTQDDLTLTSTAGAATTIIDAGSTEAIKVDAANVTIGGSGFTIIGGGRGGLWVTAAGGVGLTVGDNIFHSNAYGESRGIYAEGLSGALIDNNEFSGSSGSAPFAAGTGMMIANADDVTISDNTAHDLKYTWLTFKSERVFAPHGVLSEHCTVDPGEIGDVAITGNEAYDNGREAVLFAVCRHSTDHEVPWAQDLEISGPVTISGNDFYNNQDGGQIDGDKTQGIYTGTVVGADNIAINQNNIYDNTEFGVLNGQTDVVDAESNWWGSVNGPEHASNTFNVGAQGDKVSDNVDFVGWTTDGVSFAPVALDGDWAYSSIQAAIDAATSGTVEAKPGTYTEDLVISKDDLELTATGATIKGVDTELWGSWPLGNPNIEIQADGVKIHGFAIESPDVPSGSYSSGVVLTGTNIEIYGNTFLSKGDGGCVVIQTIRSNVIPTSDISGLNIHDNEFGGTPNECYETEEGYVGLFINHTSTGTGMVYVQDNDFTGKICQGVVTERSKVTIADNEIITDLAPSAYGVGVIVQDWDNREQSDVSVSDNVIKGSGAGKGFMRGMSFGTTTQNQHDITVSGNEVTMNGTGIRVRSALSGTGVVINLNNIRGNTTWGLDASLASGAVPLDAENNWWGCNAGPGAAGCDTASANVDYDPWLVLKISRKPRRIVADGTSTSTITGDMTKNSDGDDTSASGHIPDGTQVTFTTNLGSLGSSQVVKPTTNGIATATLTASDTAGRARVRAKVDLQRVRTLVWMVPQAPALRSPDDGAKIGRRIVRLRWYGVPGAVVYRVQLWRAGDRANKIVNEVTTDLEYTTPALRRGRWYRWRVRAGLDLWPNRGPWGPWSEIRKFRIVPSLTDEEIAEQ